MDMTKKGKAFWASLEREEAMLVTLHCELYNGSWERMLKDLEDRLKGRPYIFKLVNRIEEDVARIKKLQEWEKENDEDLGELYRASQLAK